MIKKTTGALKKQGRVYGYEKAGPTKNRAKGRRDKIKGHPTKKMVTLEMMIARSTYNKRIAKSRFHRRKKSNEAILEKLKEDKND